MTEINSIEQAKKVLAEKEAAKRPKAAPSGREQYAATHGMDPQERAAFIAERNKRIQERGVRPVDGVTFAKKGKS